MSDQTERAAEMAWYEWQLAEHNRYDGGDTSAVAAFAAGAAWQARAAQPAAEPLSRAILAEQMGDEARKAMLLDPHKLTPALDTAVARYIKATVPAAEPVIAVVTTSHDYGATIDWTLNPLPTGTELYAHPAPAAEPQQERERINGLLTAIREHWVAYNGEDSISVGALDKIAEVIADGSYAAAPQAAHPVPAAEPVAHGGRPMTMRECMEAEEAAAPAAEPLSDALDAKRYRWLCERHEAITGMHCARALGLDLREVYVNTPAQLDAVIDAAIAAHEAKR